MRGIEEVEIVRATVRSHPAVRASPVEWIVSRHFAVDIGPSAQAHGRSARPDQKKSILTGRVSVACARCKCKDSQAAYGCTHAGALQVGRHKTSTSGRFHKRMDGRVVMAPVLGSSSNHWSSGVGSNPTPFRI